MRVVGNDREDHDILFKHTYADVFFKKSFLVGGSKHFLRYSEKIMKNERFLQNKH